MFPSRPSLIRAKAAFLASGYLDDVGIVCRNGVVQACGPFLSVATQHPISRVVDLGEMVILPGFVNAHTHLELSLLKGRIEFNGFFPRWLDVVGEYLQAAPPGELRRAVSLGVREALRAGTAALGDVALRCPAYSEMRHRSLGGVSFVEVLGLRRRVYNRLLTFRRWQALLFRPTARVRLGLSPHAPYTTSAEAYRRSVELADKRGLPLLTHVAETPAETELMTKGTGDLARLIDHRAWLPAGVSWQSPGMSPVECLAEVGFLRKSAILVHLNYPEPGDLQRVAEAGASVVFCPRSHRYFSHHDYPLRDMLRLGVNVALGTDSLASNDSLSMLPEAQLVRQAFPDLPPLVLLDMLTINGARALGLADHVGRIKEGSWSTMIALPHPSGLPGSRGQQALEALFSEPPPPKVLR